MKVWMCSNGSYSDYGVTAIYTDEATAKRVTEAYGWDNDPEEIELDPAVPPEVRQGLSYFRVWMWENGDVVQASPCDPCGVVDKTHWYESTFGHYPSYKKGWQIWTGCWAKDKTHAVKIANERRIMALATGQPPKQPATTIPKHQP